MVDLAYAPGVESDFRALKERDRALLLVVLRWIERLKTDPLVGEGLHYRYGQPASLEPCRKIYVGPDDQPSSQHAPRGFTFGGPPLRIVYELQPDEQSPRRALVLAVGRKPEVYADAASRRLQNLLG